MKKLAPTYWTCRANYCLHAKRFKISNDCDSLNYDERFTLFCEIEGSTGFNWVNECTGNKLEVLKAGTKYIIKKHDVVLPVVDGFAPLGTKNPLSNAHKQKEPNDGWLSTRNSCYSVKELLEKMHCIYMERIRKPCYETWRTNEQGMFKML